jgi:hypothetical protein
LVFSDKLYITFKSFLLGAWRRDAFELLTPAGTRIAVLFGGSLCTLLWLAQMLTHRREFSLTSKRFRFHFPLLIRQFLFIDFFVDIMKINFLMMLFAAVLAPSDDLNGTLNTLYGNISWVTVRQRQTLL